MTAKEIAQRNKKAEQLKVIQTGDGGFFVESAEGKIMYKVVLGDDGNTCNCGDFSRNVKKNKNFQCKHILSVMNAIPKKEIENVKYLEKQIPKLDERFITNIKGKDFVLYAGVLDLATQKGLLKLEVELIQFPSKENGHEAICSAVAMGKNGEVFSDIGDANPNNCHAMIVKHLIRMSSTRAKARALRDMCNIGIACLEELSDFDDVIGNDISGKATVKKTSSTKGSRSTKAKTEKKKASAKDEPKTKVEKETSSEPIESANKEAKGSEEKETYRPMSDAQKRAVYNLSRRRGISVEELEDMAAEAYGTSLEELSSKDASSFIRQLQQAA